MKIKNDDNQKKGFEDLMQAHIFIPVDGHHERVLYALTDALGKESPADCAKFLLYLFLDAYEKIYKVSAEITTKNIGLCVATIDEAGEKAKQAYLKSIKTIIRGIEE